MKVNKLQENDYNMNFKAKFAIEGHFNDIPQNVIERWTSIVKNIGTEKDTIVVNLSKEKTRSIENEYGDLKKHFGRFASISTTINGKLSNVKCALYNLNPFGVLYSDYENALVDEDFAGNKDLRLSTTIDVISKYLYDLYDLYDNVRK